MISRRNLSFRMKLTLSYVLIIIVPLSIVSIGYYQWSSNSILEAARTNYLNVLKQSNTLIDNKFYEFENGARNLHMDAELYDFFNSEEAEDQENAYLYDRKITAVLNKYFPRSDYLYTVHLITSNYTYGLNPQAWMPKEKFSGSETYLIGKRAEDALAWLPTYDLVDALRIREDGELKLDKYDELVFTATREIEFVRISNNMLQKMNPMKEKPVLAIHFKENMLQEIFNESIGLDNAYYHVLTDEGDVVSKSNDAVFTPANDKEWLDNIYLAKSGTTLAHVDGVKMLLCYDIMASTGWISVFYLPYDSLMNTLPQMLQFAVVLTLIVVGVSIVLATLISKMITGPVDKLIFAIDQMSEGDFDIGPNKVKSGEFKYLFNRFYEMNGRLDILIRENYQVKIHEQELEIKSLYFQFNPHFLYNTLNIINWLAIENDQEDISEMLVHLSDILEYTAKNEKTIVSLKEELDYIQNYINLLTRRFVDRFTVEYHIEDSLMAYNVPKFFMQPFIENAILHGFSHMESGGVIKISGHNDFQGVKFTIDDNGKGISEARLQQILEADYISNHKNRSIGVRIIHERIKKLYGQSFGVHITSKLGQGTKVEIRMPGLEWENM